MDFFVADSIEFLMWHKNLGLIFCGSSVVMLTDKWQLTKCINLKGIQNICLFVICACVGCDYKA